MLTVHHLGMSQSERIVWLCEELGIPYELRRYERESTTRFAPPELAALTHSGTAPVITDDETVLAESAAIVDYILAKYGPGSLARRYGQESFPEYLFWFHFANGNLQPVMGRTMVLGRLGIPADNAVASWIRSRQHRSLLHFDKRVTENEFLAGDGFSAADIMNVFSLTTMRYFSPLDLQPYPGILAYLQRIAARPGYQRAMAKGDPGMALLLT